MRFILVSDPKFPTAPAWWVSRVSKGDFKTVMEFHKWIVTDLAIRDGNNPHIQADRASKDAGRNLMALLKHPVFLGAGFASTAMRLAAESDFYINQRGGMRPCGDLTEGRVIESNNWPGKVDPKRRITIHTWGNHFYLTADHDHSITFLDKFNTEQAAVDFAKLFALPERITVKREARRFKEGD